jgi:hypothetical protein
MSPEACAREHCDCYQPDGSCLGIHLRADLTPYRFLKEGTRCLLSGQCQRCIHFEESILPMEKRTEWPNELMRKNFLDAAYNYRRASRALSLAARLCPICKARALESRARYCYVCAREIAREKARARVEKNRVKNGKSTKAGSGGV